MGRAVDSHDSGLISMPILPGPIQSSGMSIKITGALLDVRITQANKRSLVAELVDPVPALTSSHRRSSSLHLPVVGA